jgi:hypothetical protein
MYTSLYFFSLWPDSARPKVNREAKMRVWAFTVALFLGLVTWGAELLDSNPSPGDQQTITDGGGPDNGTVNTMEDPFGIPPPRP